MERVNGPFSEARELSKTFVAFVLRLSVPVSSLPQPVTRSLTMTRRPVHVPGQSAPAPGTYEQINVFGSPTGVRVNVAHGQPLRRRLSAMAGRLRKTPHPLMRTRKH